MAAKKDVKTRQKKQKTTYQNAQKQGQRERKDKSIFLKRVLRDKDRP